jgi:tetrahydromethanopterin S-methyltransferase subunit B
MNPDHYVADDLLQQLSELTRDLDVDHEEWQASLDRSRELLGTLPGRTDVTPTTTTGDLS